MKVHIAKVTAQVMHQHRGFAPLGDGAGKLPRVTLNIRQGQHGHGAQGFRGIRGLLPLVQGIQLCFQRCLPGGGQGSPAAVCLLALLTGAVLAQADIGHQNSHEAIFLPEQQPGNQLLQITGIQLFLQLLQVAAVVQVLGGVAVIEPRLQDVQCFYQPPGAVIIPVKELEGQGVVAAQQPLFVQTLVQQLLQGGADGLLDFGNFFFPGVPHLPAEPGLLHSVAHLYLEILAQTGIQNCPLQRRFGIACQIVGQKVCCLQLHRVIKPAQELAEGDDDLVIILALGYLVADALLPVGEGLLHGNGEGHLLLLEAA